MKIRTDFVTNSSSSSFILAFKDEASVAEELLKDFTGGYFEQLYNDIMNPRFKLSKESALYSYERNIYYSVKWEAEERLETEKHMDWKDVQDWIDTHEEDFEDMVQEEINKRVKTLEKQLEDKEYIVMVNYSDDIDGDLEHNIVPNLSSCIESISHH